MGSQLTVDVVVEIPQGNRNKYSYDKETGRLRLDSVLARASALRADYGYVPNTIAQDGKALHAMVLINSPTLPGCVVESKVVGLLQSVVATDDGRTIHALLCVAVADPEFAHFEKDEDIPSSIKDDILETISLYSSNPDESKEGFQLLDQETGLRVLHESIARSAS